MPYSRELCVGFGIVAILVPTVAVVVRFWARHLIRAQPRLDDWFILAALVFCQATAAIVIMMATVGRLAQYQTLDKNGKQVLDDPLVRHRKGEYVAQLTSVACFGLCKLSILFFYRGIFKVSRLRTATNIYIAVIIVWLLGFGFSSAFECTPVKKIWTSLGSKGMAKKYCLKLLVYFNTRAISDAVTGLIIMVLPLPVVWKMRLPRTQRLALVGVFFVGASVVLISIASAVIFVIVNRNIYSQYEDWTYYTTAIFPATLSECALSVVCASLPTMRPILDHSFWGQGKKDESLCMSLDDELRSFVHPQGAGSSESCVSMEQGKGAYNQTVPGFITTIEV